MARTQSPITSLQNFIERFERVKANRSELVIFRGQPGEFPLQPSLFRRPSDQRHEKNILREIMSLHPGEFAGDETMFSRLVRMQHYSLPTRLLDVTFNPLVALYFACASLREKDGEFISFRLPTSQLKYYDSDTVSCVANLANLTAKERNRIRIMEHSSELTSSLEGRWLLHFIRAEKPHFESAIELSHLSGFYAVKPLLMNKRMLAQQGAFIIFGLQRILDEDGEAGFVVRRTRVPAQHKGRLLRQLDHVGINQSTLFPEIESAARYIMSSLTPIGGEDERAPWLDENQSGT